MTKKSRKRNYKKEYKDYHSKPAQKKRRAARNTARMKLEKEGRVELGDRQDVHHLDGNPQNNEPSNLQVRSESVNRADKEKKKKRNDL